jgi:hypothetical protein
MAYTGGERNMPCRKRVGLEMKTKKAPDSAPWFRAIFILEQGPPTDPTERPEAGLRDVTWLHAILPLNVLHLILEPQLELLEPDFFQLFVIRQETFFGELFESLGVLGVFHG